MISRVDHSLAIATTRGGDFLHPGGAEFIDHCFNLIGAITGVDGVLDFGSGLGGTCGILIQRGFKAVTGLECDNASVQYAQKRYPSASFICYSGDLADFPRLPVHYGLIFANNVFYLIGDKEGFASHLRAVSLPKARLIVSDYTLRQLDKLPGETLSAAGLQNIEVDGDYGKHFEAVGFAMVHQEILDSIYIASYESLLRSLAFENTEIEPEVMAFLKNRYGLILDCMKRGIIGGRLAIYERQ